MKERITITVRKDLLAWLDERIERRIFANRSHGIEYLLRQKLEEEKEGKK